MAVLIAIEIFVNIVSYLRDDVIHVRIVLATALMAIARKVIILDYSTTARRYIYATAAVVAAMALAYWLVVRTRPPRGVARRRRASALRALARHQSSLRVRTGSLLADGLLVQFLLHPPPEPALLPEVLDDERDDGDEVELAEDRLEDRRHAPETGRGGEVAVPGGRDGHEAEVQVVDGRRVLGGAR